MNIGNEDLQGIDKGITIHVSPYVPDPLFEKDRSEGEAYFRWLHLKRADTKLTGEELSAMKNFADGWAYHQLRCSGMTVSSEVVTRMLKPPES